MSFDSMISFLFCFSFPPGNAIQAFGYGSLPKPDPHPTTSSVKPDLEPTASVPKTTMETGEDPCIISSCPNLNVSQIWEGQEVFVLYIASNYR